MKISDLLFRVFVQPALGCFVRALVDRAKEAADTAKTTGANLGLQASGERAFLQPRFQREADAEHLFDPSQTNEMLTYALAGTGGAEGSAQAGLDRLAASTSNPSGFVKSAQEMARDRMKTAANASEGVAAQDVLGAKQLNQQGLAGMQGLYGENLKGQLEAMGQVSGDINAATNASKTGWLQDVEGAIKTGADVASMGNPMKNIRS